MASKTENEINNQKTEGQRTADGELERQRERK